MASYSFVSCRMVREDFDFLMASQASPYLFNFEMNNKCMKFLVFMPLMVNDWSVVLVGSGM